MAMATECAGCGVVTSWICAAQFCSGEEHLIICWDCWQSGKRCFFGPGGLIVSDTAPSGYREADLYWDEGCYVTGGTKEIHYPNCGNAAEINL